MDSIVAASPVPMAVKVALRVGSKSESPDSSVSAALCSVSAPGRIIAAVAGAPRSVVGSLLSALVAVAAARVVVAVGSSSPLPLRR